jgi:transposase
MAVSSKLTPRPFMTAAERDLARKLYHEKGKEPSEIADIFDRDHSTITRLLFVRKKAMKAGRKAMLTEAQVDNLVKRLDEMITKAKAKKEINVAALKRRTKCKAGEKTILRALHERGLYFHVMRQKPILTPEDVKERVAFAKKYKDKSADWWNEHVRLFIDLKKFPVYLTGKSRDYAARRRIRGVFRMKGKKGQGLNPGYVKDPKGDGNPTVSREAPGGPCLPPLGSLASHQSSLPSLTAPHGRRPRNHPSRRPRSSPQPGPSHCPGHGAGPPRRSQPATEKPCSREASQAGRQPTVQPARRPAWQPAKERPGQPGRA